MGDKTVSKTYAYNKNAQQSMYKVITINSMLILYYKNIILNSKPGSGLIVVILFDVCKSHPSFIDTQGFCRLWQDYKIIWHKMFQAQASNLPPLNDRRCLSSCQHYTHGVCVERHSSTYPYTIFTRADYSISDGLFLFQVHSYCLR